MCDRDDVEVVLTHPIHNLVRKAGDEHTAVWQAPRSKRADLGMRPNELNRPNDGLVEVGA